MQNWYLIKDTEKPGAYNMALDKYLADDPPDMPLLRIYYWDPPAVSLGYGQNLIEYNKNIFDILNIDIVYRPTGGRAVLHKNEITYSVIIPENSEYFKCGIHELYRIISEALLTGLTIVDKGFKIERNIKEENKYTNNVNCYDSIARFEIKLNGKKIVGSAQRRLKNGILQHGSILFENNQHLLKYLLIDKNDKLESLVEKFNAVRNVFNDGIDKKTIEEALITGFKRSIVKDFCEYKINESNMEVLREKEKEYLVYKSKKDLD